MSVSSSSSDKSLSASPLSPVLGPAGGRAVKWRGLHGSARGLAIASAAVHHNGPLLVIARSVPSAYQLADEIRFYAPDPQLPVRLFADTECLPYDVFSPHQGLIAERLETLYRFPTLTRGVVLVAASTLLQRLPPPGYVARYSFMLDIGDRLEIETLRQRLTQAGYRTVTQVMEPGEYAVRGGLIDLYPVGGAHPYRIDLFDDRVETIREFDPETQRSGQVLSEIQLLPAREVPLTDDAVQKFRQRFRARFEGDPQKVLLYRDVSKGISPPGIEFFMPLFFDTTATLFDYAPAGTLFVMEHGVEQAARDFARDVQARY